MIFDGKYMSAVFDARTTPLPSRPALYYTFSFAHFIDHAPTISIKKKKKGFSCQRAPQMTTIYFLVVYAKIMNFLHE